jgi:hypothetical protein
MGTLKLRVPEGMDAGVAPAASTVVVAVPASAVLPREAAASTIVDGIGTEV